MSRTQSRVNGGAGTLPRLISVEEAAALLAVDGGTVRDWIDEDAIPYVELPTRTGARRRFRIPLQGLLNTLGGNHDLAGELEQLLEAAPPGTKLKDILAERRSHRLPHTSLRSREIPYKDPGEEVFTRAAGRGPDRQR